MKRTLGSIAGSPTNSQESREISAWIRAAEFASDSSVPWHKLPADCRVTFYSNGYLIRNSRGRELFRHVQTQTQAVA